MLKVLITAAILGTACVYSAVIKGAGFGSSRSSSSALTPTAVMAESFMPFPPGIPMPVVPGMSFPSSPFQSQAIPVAQPLQFGQPIAPMPVAQPIAVPISQPVAVPFPQPVPVPIAQPVPVAVPVPQPVPAFQAFPAPVASPSPVVGAPLNAPNPSRGGGAGKSGFFMAI
ncbi:tetra-peptide repeat homeobox protein 1-like [Artemia franciscana]|uniref:tetra-peptide repeat homeobox protein 1-like n=1 Tax=Artemia franciscana TaxID=6661 RepID=UPI0032DA3C60